MQVLMYHKSHFFGRSHLYSCAEWVGDSGLTESILAFFALSQIIVYLCEARSRRRNLPTALTRSDEKIKSIKCRGAESDRHAAS